MDTLTEKEKSSGDFTSKIKFTEFVGGKGYLNFISDEATIKGKYLSGLTHQDVVFKLKIYSDGTVDFTELDTNFTTEDERKRLFEIIEDQTITPYRGRTVINELPFTSIEKVKDKTVPLYLAVEIPKPIDLLGDIVTEEFDVSEDALNNLNSLLDSWVDEDETDSFEVESDSDHIESVLIEVIPNQTNSYLEDQFAKIKEEKIKELKEKKSKVEKDINKLDFQISTLEKSLSVSKSELKLLDDRLDDLQPIEPFNGYYFNISERQNETVTLEPEIEKLIRDKVSKVKSINVENFMKLFTDGEYRIKLATKENEDFLVVEDFQNLNTEISEVLDKLYVTLDPTGLVYHGESSWGEMVNKFVKMGFKQDPEFDKLCGSNSYTSSEETKETAKTKKTKF